MIIGISGILEDKDGRQKSAGTGKDTVADFLVGKYNFKKISLADPIKRFCVDTLKFSHQQVFGPSAFREAPDERYTMLSGEPLTPRFALQTLGTEWGRNCYPNIWLDYFINVAQTLMNSTSYRYEPYRGLYESIDVNRISGVVNSDVRFLNEFQKIKSVGKAIRVRRKVDISFASGPWQQMSLPGFKPKSEGHQSEIELLNVPDSEFDYVLDNNGTIDELYMKISKMMETF